MDPKLVNNIRNILGIATIKQQINEYLEYKNIGPGDLVYPPIIQDLKDVSSITNRIELIPFMEDLDPSTGYVKIGWNLFVLGTNKKFLGYSIHESLSDLNRPELTEDSMRNSICYTTGSDILNFIVETLQKYNEDFISIGSMKSVAPQTYASKMPISNTFYEKNKSIGRKT